MKALLPVLVCGCLFVNAAPAPAAERPPEALVEKVRKAIEDGKNFLRTRQKDDGGWEDPIENGGKDGGWTSLALLALLNGGEKPNSPAVQRGLAYLRKIEPKWTYVVGLQTMVFAEARFPEDRQRIKRNVEWLIENRVTRGDATVGWGYETGSKSSDNSNTQYALLGLHAGKSAGIAIDAKVWASIQRFYIDTQLKSGGWGYSNALQQLRPTMSIAGLCGLLITGMELSEGRQKLRGDGVAENCGIYAENEPVQLALKWFSEHFVLEDYRGYVFYHMYGVERAGRLSGLRFFGEHDWYRRGCDYLVKAQSAATGSWALQGGGSDRWPIVSTSFALLFLSKGRTPVLVSKLVHGNDWNNKHNDCRNLVEYASKELFDQHPLAWQIFNPRQSPQTAEELAGELLSSPIAYFNGHGRPDFQGRDLDMLKLYIEQGGFLLVEACCGSQKFDTEFKALMKQLFPEPEHALKELPPDHPIWTAHAKLAPKEFPLLGMEFGCRTSVVYSPKPISGYWEANNTKDGQGLVAFRLAGNIIAYATGMELPKPKGTEIKVSTTENELKVPRGFLKVGQLRHTNDRFSTTGVTRNLMLHLRQTARVDVALQAQELEPSSKELLKFKFLYMHGRGDFDIDQLDNLKANLQTGGLLFADACCGKPAYDTAFRKFVKKLFPDKELEPIPVEDDLYSKELNGTAISSVRCRRAGGEAGFKDAAPYLEGIKIDGRWVVIYSKYDIGCALEKHASSDCLGHDHASALKLAGAVVLYAMQR